MERTFRTHVSAILLLAFILVQAVPVTGQSIGEFEYLGPVEDEYQGSHKVMPGESLYSIARQYGITVEDLSALNQLENEVIYPGQRLIVAPQQEANMRTRGTTQNTNARTTNILPPMSGYADMERRQYYQVRDGERLEDIAARYRVHPDKLREWNAISSVYPGQTLIVDKWVERVDAAELRGRQASANLRTTRGQQEAEQPSRAFEMEPVGNLETFAQGPFASSTRGMDNTASNQETYRTAAPAPTYEQVQDGEWLMERPSYNTYRQTSNTRGADGSSYQRTYQRSPEPVFESREVSGPYDVVEDRYRGETNPFYAFHNELPAGAKVEIQIPNNSGFIEVEVVGPMPRGTRGMIALSPAAARIIQGGGYPDQRVTVRY